MATALALALMASTEATLNCQSPTGSYRVGDSVSMRWGDNGWWPKAGDVYSATANVYCSSGGKITSFGVSNGDSWTIPDSAYGRCSGNQLYVEYTGNLWDVAHWFHVLPFWNKCSSFTNPQPTTAPPVPPPTQAPVTTPPPPVFTTTLTLVPTVIDGTTTVVPVTTVIQVNTTAVVPPAVQTTASFDPNASEIPQGLPSGAGGQSNRNNNNSNNNSNVPVAALASVGGVAALALIVFGLVMTRKHKRLRREQGLDKENNYSYGAELAAAGGAGAAAIVAPASTHSSFNNHPMPYLSPPVYENYHNPDYDFLAASAGATVASRGMGEYGQEEGFASSNTRRISDPAAGSLAFPVPPSTVNTFAANAAMKQQFALAGRLSIESQESGGFAAAVAGAGAGAAAAAVNQQMSLKQEFDDDSGSMGEDGLYYLQTNSPVQTFQSEFGTPMSTASGNGRTTPLAMTDATRTSAYDTVPSSSSAYATADSPTLSAASLQSQDIHVPGMEPSDWRLTGSGRPESSHIRDLIRNVLDD
ncbi:hypothetical protein BGZ82_000760 [Podila clonocystis]|nr:hypothetical protein BGZ82_000760 [Podila clonocystis]